MVPEVIHIFSPLRMYSSPDLRAVVVMPPGFDPNPGSVSPKQPSFSPRREGREPGILLLVGAEGVDGIHDERRLHADEAAQPGVAALELLHDKAVFDIGHAGASVAFEIGAEEAELAHDRDELAREAADAKAFFDDGHEVVVDEVAGGAADEQLFFIEAGVEMEKIESLKLESHARVRLSREWKGKG